MRTYPYVGPPEIKTRSATQPPGRDIRTPADVLIWLKESDQSLDKSHTIPATFVITTDRRLLIADRHSEHVACAAGQDVLAAGEIFFTLAGQSVAVDEITNQSTGHCPEPTCWPAVEAALQQIGLVHPRALTTECTFRKCEHCGARNIVKGNWFYCDVCRAPLPAQWNFA